MLELGAGTGLCGLVVAKLVCMPVCLCLCLCGHHNVEISRMATGRQRHDHGATGAAASARAECQTQQLAREVRSKKPPGTDGVC